MKRKKMNLRGGDMMIAIWAIKKKKILLTVLFRYISNYDLKLGVDLVTLPASLHYTITKIAKIIVFAFYCIFKSSLKLLLVSIIQVLILVILRFHTALNSGSGIEKKQVTSLNQESHFSFFPIFSNIQT